MWRCAEPLCRAGTWSETSDQIQPRASLTERARREACRLVGEDGLNVAAVADHLGVGWATVMRAVRDYGTPLIDDPTRLVGVVAVGVDETTFLAARAGTSTQFVTGIVAMPGPGRTSAQLLDVVPGRTKSDDAPDEPAGDHVEAVLGELGLEQVVLGPLVPLQRQPGDQVLVGGEPCRGHDIVADGTLVFACRDAEPPPSDWWATDIGEEDGAKFGPQRVERRL